MTFVDSLNNDDYVIVDMDDGTVIGTNVRLVPTKAFDNVDLADNDAVFRIGMAHGIHVTANVQPIAIHSDGMVCTKAMTTKDCTKSHQYV